MTFLDAVLVVACAVLTLAWLESQFGLRIGRHWHRAYDALADALRHTPPHLRGRVPMECGEGTPSATRLRVVVQPRRPTPAENARRYAAEGGTW